MHDWPATPSRDTLAVPDDREFHRLDVYLDPDGQLADVQLDGESVYPTWFKIEWKETGDVSAKVKGFRLASRYGDSIIVHRALSGTGDTSGNSV
ncbi:MAG: hypothetical protein NVSMB2_09130 [Chloroflexota bacterium]